MLRVRALPGLLPALVLHLFLGGAYLLSTPAFEAPDEGDHMWALWFMERTWTLPLPRGASKYCGKPELAWKEHDLGHHPPLYYGLLAAGERLFLDRDLAPTWHPDPRFLTRGGTSRFKDLHGWDERRGTVSSEVRALWVLRGFSLLCGLVLVWGAWALAREIFPGRPGIWTASALAVACLPQFSATFSVLDNGNLAAALSAPVLLLLVRALRRGNLTWRGGILLGLFAGLALMAKLTALFLVPAGLLLLGIALLERRRGALPLIGPAGAALAVLVLLSGWFFVRNYMLFGDWTGEAPKLIGYASNRVPAGRVWDYLSGPFLTRTWETFVGCFGWESLPLPRGVLEGLLLVPLLALLGWIPAARRILHGRGSGRAVLFLLACVLLSFAGLVQYNRVFVQPQGRYLFAVLPAVAVLASGGLAGLFSLLPGRGALAAGRVLALGWILFALGVYFLFFRPAFSPEKPTAGPLDACLTFGLCTPPSPSQPRIELTGPPDGARLGNPPRFSWKLPPSWKGRTVTVHCVRPEGSLLFATWEWPRLALRGESWTMPDWAWRSLPKGVPISWKVRVVPDRSRGERVDRMPESGFRTFFRR